MCVTTPSFAGAAEAELIKNMAASNNFFSVEQLRHIKTQFLPKYLGNFGKIDNLPGYESCGGMIESLRFCLKNAFFSEI